MALTYTQDHNWWVQRVNKEIVASSRFNMYNSQSLFNYIRKPPEQVNPPSKKPSRPSTAKSVALSHRSLNQNIPSSIPKVSQSVPEVHPPKPPDSETKPQTEIRPSSSRSNAQILKTNHFGLSKAISQRNSVKLPDDLKSNLSQKSNTSIKSLASKTNSNTLKTYIKELEDLLRQEKLKRIETEESLKKALTRSSWRSNEKN